ncbi:hypothetical protein AB0I72_20030 [Nocardiopsis sp. NPDC049922]|uniref:hypothetical protein n=1 Tax=Nocardiopsis sp. NPDC049922 TaxID=3155157 RepID=UPI0033E7A4C8
MSTEYVSPDGATQTTDNPVVEVRLRARGWRPRPELESAAEHDKAAAARLEKAHAARADADQRATDRRAALDRSPATGAAQARTARPDTPRSRARTAKTKTDTE